MKMGFLLKNNARKGMEEEKECSKRERKRRQKKGEEKECSKKGEEKEAEKKASKIREF